MPDQPLNALAVELQDFTTAVVTRAHLNAPDLRRVLSFIAKVSHVAEQAFQDVVVVLVEIKYLTPNDVQPERIRELRKQVDLLTAQSRYRDVEEICSRLHHLTDQYHQFKPLLSSVADTQAWQGMLGLIEEHEGRLIHFVHDTTSQLQQRLEKLDSASLGALNGFAADQLIAVRKGLDQLRDLSNKILGVSGTEGLLELTAEAGGTNAVTSLFVHGGDRYEIGQAGAVGPSSHAENMTFNQIGNKPGSDIDVQELAGELTALRSALSKAASESDHFVALGEVALAEKAARGGDGPTALQHLKKAGAWVWGIATTIGIGVATAAAKSAFGI
jgi:hypothetical protein